MRLISLNAAVVVSLLALGSSASAQEAFQIKGTWKGDGIAVISGNNPYREAEGQGPSFPPNIIEFTYEIVQQEGNRFSGKSTGGDHVESLIGAINPDNQRAIMLDDDGQYDLTIVDANTINACYHHLKPNSRAVGCYQLKKQ